MYSPIILEGASLMAHEGKEFICNSGGTGDVDLIPGSGKWELAPIILFFFSSSYLKSPMDSRAWWATVQRFTKSQIQLSQQQYRF